MPPAAPSARSNGRAADTAGTVSTAGTAGSIETVESVVTSVLATVAPPSFPLVTPVGPDGLAITTHAACDCPRGTMSATLPSGSVVGVEVLDPDGPFVVVSLPANAGVAAMAIADSSHGAPSTMTVMYGGVYTPIDPQSRGSIVHTRSRTGARRPRAARRALHQR